MAVICLQRYAMNIAINASPLHHLKAIGGPAIARITFPPSASEAN